MTLGAESMRHADSGSDPGSPCSGAGNGSCAVAP